MYPHDNIFQIYYNIGKRLPFQVKRSPSGLKGSRDEKYRYSQEGRTFMVEKIIIHNKIYGTAYGYCMIDGVRDDDNEYMKIPCAGCGEWVLIDIPGVDMNEVFPLRGPDYVLPFGKYKGKTLKEIYAEDPKYVYWLAETDRYFRIDFSSLTGIDLADENADQQVKTEVDRVFPKTTIDDIVTFGKYNGLKYKTVIQGDIQYIEWLLKNNTRIDFDIDSFTNEINKTLMEKKAKTKEELIERLKAIAADGTPRVRHEGAMCYSMAAPPEKHQKCDSCGIDICYYDWNRHDNIVELVQEMAKLGYDVKVEHVCMSCGKKLKKEIYPNMKLEDDEGFDWDKDIRISELNHVFYFRISSEEKYHRAIANSVEQYKSVLCLFQNKAEYQGGFGRNHFIDEELDTLEFMTGIHFEI